MGKSQPLHLVTTASANCPSSDMDVESQVPPKWDEGHPKYDGPFLSACHDKVYLQERPLIGSPPPKSQAKSYWEDPETYMNSRLEIPNFNGDHQNNNSKCDDQNRQKEERGELMDLSSSVQGLRLQPIIVCEYVDDSNDRDSAVGMSEDKEEALALSVPPVDVRNEKKRPPISGLNA